MNKPSPFTAMVQTFIKLYGIENCIKSFLLLVVNTIKAY